eukprot:1147689-Pelagomonas_calceolata.AAC.8
MSTFLGMRESLMALSSKGVVGLNFIVLFPSSPGEEALRRSGMPYTVVRPAGLKNTPPQQDEIVAEQCLYNHRKGLHIKFWEGRGQGGSETIPVTDPPKRAKLGLFEMSCAT